MLNQKQIEKLEKMGIKLYDYQYDLEKTTKGIKCGERKSDCGEFDVEFYYIPGCVGTWARPLKVATEDQERYLEETLGDMYWELEYGEVKLILANDIYVDYDEEDKERFANYEE